MVNEDIEEEEAVNKEVNIEEELEEESETAEAAEIVTIDPSVFKVSVDKKVKVEGIPEYDPTRFIYHEEDGMITPIVDENGCPVGYKWSEKFGRCVPDV